METWKILFACSLVLGYDLKRVTLGFKSWVFAGSNFYSFNVHKMVVDPLIMIREDLKFWVCSVENTGVPCSDQSSVILFFD